MTRQEIEKALADAREALADVEEERAMTLGGTGIHLGAERAAYLREKFETEAAELRAVIEGLEKRLAESAE